MGADLRGLDRLAQSATLGSGGLALWRQSRMGVIGAGLLGSRLAPELVRSGAAVTIFDPQSVAEENLGTQAFNRTGEAKAILLRETCCAIRHGRADAQAVDVRHAGIGQLASMQALVDCTDDPGLEWPLTEISNGLGIPLVRVAVDGSGLRELGRVQVSDGGRGGACRLCSKSAEQLILAPPRTPCPDGAIAQRPPTLAGNAIALTVVGIAVLQLQRLIGETAVEKARSAHVVVDLDAGQLLWGLERRCEACVSGHARWDLQPIDVDARRATLGELFDRPEIAAGAALEFYGHPLCTSAACICGSHVAAVGSRWAAAPPCPSCGATTHWQRHTQQSRWTEGEAARAAALDRTLAELGLPERGAMLVVRVASEPPRRMVLT